MIFYPAIDLKDGECVRLLRGNMEAATVFNNDPAAQAKSFEALGCKWLHLVDLNGAFLGRPVNTRAVDKILNEISIPVELGGGIRDRDTIEMWLDKGVSRVILGTTAVRDPNFVCEVCRAYPGKVAVGIDARNDGVAVEGWATATNITAQNLALKFEDVGVAALIYTDISRDGAMAGPNIEATMKLAEAVNIPVILSGGVSSMDDLKEVKRVAGTNLDGLICGRAVYDGLIDVAEATEILAAG